ncbi:esterase/lipase family protein [Halorientalis pallida]|uniref:esterase/lipase family protein n=1 Tax=Halorientalis pallida TaxID=2479928 RepID=UPI003C6F3F01
MSVDRGSGRSRPVFQQLTSNLAGLRRCRRNGGCRVDCRHERTAAHRLPWSASGYGGWGGHEHHDTDAGSSETPVVFVHGNQRDACDWDAHAEFCLNRAFSGDDLWAITFESGSPSHARMADQLDDFVAEVRAYTGSDEVSVVAHSLGVTGARYWLLREDRYDWIDTCVFMAGANHGSVLNSYAASAGLTGGTYKMSDFLRRDYDTVDGHPLAALNENETPGDVDYYTIRGTDDPLFWNCEDSPALEGAENVLLRTDHDGVRASLTSMELTYEWLTGEKPYNLKTTLRS